MSSLQDARATASENLVGARIGAWQLDSVLGEGATAVVYKAHRLHNGSEYDAQVAAVKVLHPDAGANPKVRAALEHENRILMKLRQPGIVRAYDFGMENGRIFLAMSLVEGKTLEEMVTPGLRLGENIAIEVTTEVARILATMHRQRIVHRDIKPGNILFLEGSRRPMLFDFGAAIDLSYQQPEPGVVYGTPAYVSPEQARGDVTIDGRSDIYSLGVTLYRIVAGRKPFYGTRMELLAAQVETPPPRPSKFGYVAPQLEAIILKALAKSPDDRFQDGDAMADALLEARKEIDATPPTLGSRIRNWMLGPPAAEL